MLVKTGQGSQRHVLWLSDSNYKICPSDEWDSAKETISWVDAKTKLDILNFWRPNQFRYPKLAFMVDEILSIPVSTVTSESAFSFGDRVLDQYQCANKPDNVEVA